MGAAWKHGLGDRAVAVYYVEDLVPAGPQNRISNLNSGIYYRRRSRLLKHRDKEGLAVNFTMMRFQVLSCIGMILVFLAPAR